jgi:arginase family enzyme
MSKNVLDTGDVKFSLNNERNKYNSNLSKGLNEIIKKKFKNPLVIGADHSRMGIFYKLSSKFPIIYIENKY